MYGVYRESAFVTPLLLVFFVYLVIFTVAVAFLSPLFTARREMIVRVDNKTIKVTKTFTGYLTILEEHECSAPTYDDCTDDQKNVTISSKYNILLILCVAQHLFEQFVTLIFTTLLNCSLRVLTLSAVAIFLSSCFIVDAHIL